MSQHIIFSLPRQIANYKHALRPFSSDWQPQSLSLNQKVCSVACASLAMLGTSYLGFGVGLGCGVGILTNHIVTAIFKKDNFLSSLPTSVGKTTMSILEKANSLTEENLNAVIGHQNPVEVAMALSYLQEANILTQENKDAVIGHQKPFGVAGALSQLQEANILTQENKDAVIGHQKPLEVARALSQLQAANILTQENKDAVVGHQNPLEVAEVLSQLQAANILTQENKDAVIGHQNPLEVAIVARALSDLQAANMLTQENFNAVIGHQNPFGVAWAFSALQAANMLTQENFNAIIGHQNPLGVARALSSLQAANILTQENFNAIIGHQNPVEVATALSDLQAANILTQDRFNLCLEFCHLMDDLNRIPRHLFTVQVFDAIVQRCRQPNPTQQVRDYVNQLIGNVHHGAAMINPGQSTHTTSVHKSVSESAIRLYNRYATQLNSDGVGKILEQIGAYNFADLDAQKGVVAKDCLIRISAPTFTFTDPESGRSVHEMLALAWIALHDDTQRIGSFEDGMKILMEGLYEIERGYNLNQQGEDDGERSREICVAGTFNKIVEKLIGLHPDATLIYMTKATSALKLQSVVKEEFKAYLQRENMSLDEISDETWEKIRPNVASRLEEGGYRSLYPSDNAFAEFIDAGRWTDISKIH